MENRIDTTSLAANKGLRGGIKLQAADPNELLIGLIASGIRLSWTPREHRNRAGIARFRVDYRDPVSLSGVHRSSN